MRFTPAALALAVVFATVSSAGLSQRPDTQIAPLSLDWQARGEALRTAGKLAEANDAFESALAADPRNRKAFLNLAEIARTQGLPGKSVRFYNEMLILDPADIDALGGQGQAMLDKGAIAQANSNLSKMRSLCRGDCPAMASLASAIAAKSLQAEATARQGVPPVVPTQAPPAQNP